METDGKEYFVTKPELARKMIEKIPDNEWKKAENILTVNSKVGEWVIEIYKKYHLPENLQMHMLRVAACSNLIIDNWNGTEINKESIIRVCLLHDMGNMVKIPEDFSKNEAFLKIRKKTLKKEK